MSAATKKKNSGGFLAMPHVLLNAENYLKLSPKAVKLLFDIGVQYKGKNNGDLQAAWGPMAARGWKSRDTLNVALQELQHYGLIEKTRQGSLNRCNLFALTWLAIDDCNGKLDVGPTRVASRRWQDSKKPFLRPKEKKASPISTFSQHDGCEN